MQLRFMDDKGQRVTVQLGSGPITIGRAEEADITIPGGNVSRVHSSIRQWDEDFIIKDLNSENGTLVNGKLIDICKLAVGDKITVGSYSLFFEKESARTPSPDTIIKTIGQEMNEGRKGYSTMLVEIVREADDPS